MWGQLRQVQQQQQQQREHQKQQRQKQEAAVPVPSSTAPAPAPTAASTPTAAAVASVQNQQPSASVSASASASVLASKSEKTAAVTASFVSSEQQQAQEQQPHQQQNAADVEAKTDADADADESTDDDDKWGFDDDPFFADDAEEEAKNMPGKTSQRQSSKNNVDDLADNDTAAAIVGAGTLTGTGSGGRMPTTRSQKQRTKGADGADTTAHSANNVSDKNNEKEEEEEELIPPSSTAYSRRQRIRTGASAGNRSAVQADRAQRQQQQQNQNQNQQPQQQKQTQTQTQTQKAVAEQEMKLAERKFAAAVQKIAEDDFGGGEDDDDNFGDSNWDLDDDDDDDDDGHAASRTTTATDTGSELHGRLVQYLSSLSGVDTPLVRSLNSLLKAELNTAENCAELIHYYTTRPQLLEYTIDTELTRMDYLVISQYDQYVDKTDIKLYVETTSDRIDDTESLIWRASNQSILADLIASLTGDDRLIRPSLMVTAVAETCKFELNLVGGDGSNRGVAVMSDLVLSIPFADGQGESSRLVLGKVKARVLFVPELQQLEYSIVHATALISHDDDRLEAAAAALERDLAELGIGGAAMAQGPHVDQLSRTAHDDLRDQFLATVSTGASGLSSALREFDSVTNVSGKLGWLKAAIPSLPSADVIAQAESEATSVHGAVSPPATHHRGSFPRLPTDNTNRGHGFLDRLADKGQQASEPPQRVPPQPGSPAIGFLDRLVNEMEAPDQQSSQFPRPTPSLADNNSNHFEDNERFPRPPVQPVHAAQFDRQFQPRPPAPTLAPAPAPSAAGKAPLIGGFLVRGLANAAKGLAEAAVAADELAETSYSRPNQKQDEEVKFYRQTNVDDSIQEPLIPSDMPSPTYSEKIEQRGMPRGDVNDAGHVNISANAPDSADGDDIGDSGGWSDDDDIGVDDEEEVRSHLEGKPNSPPAAPTELPMNIDGAKPEPSFRSFADRLSDAFECSSTTATSQNLSRPVQNMAPAPASISGASASTCDGSYQFVSMKSLQDELPEPKDWLAVEAVDAVDEQSGIIPTRSRWQPRRMRASKC